MIKITAQNKFNENENENANEILVDLTQVCNILSPYYPHGDIPVLNSPYLRLNSVNEVWQILCVKNNGMERIKMYCLGKE